MKKKLLLTALIGLCSISMADAACTPPATLKCECQHPIINSNGKLACGEDYCAKNGKKCMPDGSCCESDKFCDSTVGKQCCSDGQVCDIISGCVEEKNLEALCADAKGDILELNSGIYCISKEGMYWDKANSWCSDNKMELVSVEEICGSDWTKSNWPCSGTDGGNFTEFWTSTANGVFDNIPYYIYVQPNYWGSFSSDTNLPACCRMK